LAESLPHPSDDPIERTENRWLMAMLGLLAVMMAVVVATSLAHALHPPSNVEVIDPLTLHLAGEFVESNLGAAAEPDGSVTVRMLAQQYSFVPHCVTVPADTPVKFRLTSADVLHGFLLIDTNVNSMVVPGFISEVRTRFARSGDNAMPCHEYCGLGHAGMWAHVIVVPKDQFPSLSPRQRLRCAAR
jgi:cytochrome c oxidase subunit 2